MICFVEDCDWDDDGWRETNGKVELNRIVIYIFRTKKKKHHLIPISKNSFSIRTPGENWIWIRFPSRLSRSVSKLAYICTVHTASQAGVLTCA